MVVLCLQREDEISEVRFEIELGSPALKETVFGQESAKSDLTPGLKVALTRMVEPRQFRCIRDRQAIVRCDAVDQNDFTETSQVFARYDIENILNRLLSILWWINRGLILNFNWHN